MKRRKMHKESEPALLFLFSVSSSFSPLLVKKFLTKDVMEFFKCSTYVPLYINPMQYAGKRQTYFRSPNTFQLLMAMKLGSLFLFVVLLTDFALTNSKAANTDPPIVCDSLNRSSFDSLVPGFIFGTSSAAYQVEGAWNESGRGPSVWDNFTQQYPVITTMEISLLISITFIRLQNHILTNFFNLTTTEDIEGDSFSDRDVQIMKNMSMDAYRFSISWSRLLPNGTLSGGINKEGIEYYNNLTNELLSNAPQLTFQSSFNEMQAASNWLYVYPKGIQDFLLYTKEKYNDPLIYITENGVDEFNDPTLPLPEALNDTNRIDYYNRHLCYVQAAIKNGTNVKGYFAWSVLDNFEWDDGYTVRFGINYVDYESLQRSSKSSTYWFQSFLNKSSNNTEEIKSFVDGSVGNTEFDLMMAQDIRQLE
ncbi:hypothetical protein DVH24_041986 [Malus domestica]|uniref:Beta-glucosidase n=1 Tax=Malus domestica TaxID=3750 RepID=A0A498INV8_MALDO|nr:hypothetical protein DVH24_041986 [Malus domestica]